MESTVNISKISYELSDRGLVSSREDEALPCLLRSSCSTLRIDRLLGIGRLLTIRRWLGIGWLLRVSWLRICRLLRLCLSITLSRVSSCRLLTICRRLLAIGMRLLAITLRLAMGARAIVREAIWRAIRRAITHAISSWEPTHPIWRAETTSKSTPAIGPHSSHWSK